MYPAILRRKSPLSVGDEAMDRSTAQRRSPSSVGNVAKAAAAGAALLTALVPSSGVLAQSAPAASSEDIQQMRAELAAIKAESDAAKAAEAAREAKIDDLQRRLEIAAGLTPTPEAPPPSVLGPQAKVPAEVAAEVAALPPSVIESNPEANTLPQANTRFEIYGFAQADYIQDFNRMDPAWNDTLRPSKIPTIGGQFGSNGVSSISVKQSRFGVQGSEPIGGHDLKWKFEFDLFGVGVDAGQTTFRLRHAFGQWGPVLAGQTNSLFMDGDIFPNTIDYWGPTGMVFLRNPQFRVTLYDDGKASFKMAVEKPGNDVDAGQIREFDPSIGANLQAHNPYPDLTAQARYGDSWGHLQVAGILRNLGYETLGTAGNFPRGQKTGWGVDATGTLRTWGNDKILAGVVYGQGIANYMNDGGTDLAAGGTQQLPVATPVPLLGISAYYDHFWNKYFSSSLGWSETRVYNTSLQEGPAYKYGQYTSVNFLWTPDKRLLFGTEFLWGERTDFNGLNGGDYRLQFTAKYSFSSKDWFK
jgi:hypothetical protein